MFTFELHSTPGALGTKIWKGKLPLKQSTWDYKQQYSQAETTLLEQEGATWDEEWQAWWLSGDASRDPSGQQTRQERAEELVVHLNKLSCE